MEANLQKIWMKIKNKKNVIGYSGSLKKKIVNGKEIDGTHVFRVYVSIKVPLEELEENDIIPEFIDGVELDIVEIGKIKALNDTFDEK
jgi:hypothetical protein